MFTAYANFWKHYIDFKGRTKRSEFWWPFLFNNLIRLAFYLIVLVDLIIPFGQRMRLMEDSALSTDGLSIWTDISPLMVTILILWGLFELAILVPSLSIGVRRLRDAAFHWAFIFMYGAALLLNSIPWVGWFLAAALLIASIVLWAFPSREPKPKANVLYAPLGNQFTTAPQQSAVPQQMAGFQQPNPAMIQAQQASATPQQSGFMNSQVSQQGPAVPQGQMPTSSQPAVGQGTVHPQFSNVPQQGMPVNGQAAGGQQTAPNQGQVAPQGQVFPQGQVANPVNPQPNPSPQDGQVPPEQNNK
ncbi:membrane protein [Streptococcus criceti]|uniref:DUF805 domain-containing protein n=1 Tax=Streptococcus criceti HS-6 TaxID=873449 RepID=G5JT57_STRCG|nr:DUF805 domain-containing protein [Streptococcus criceti]EHI75533.1 hypothetical protein STRCR_1025 [Streptococcus criceti HS-6]SUN37603.1 membrane protein [Streptococcus criceti]